MPRILMLLTMKAKALWVVTLCTSDETLHIGGTNRLQLPPASAGFLPVLFFDPEDVGDLLIGKVGLSQNYKMLQHRRSYCSESMAYPLLQQ
jgi:hypothetical protein